MEMRKTIKVLVYSCLAVLVPGIGLPQDALFCAHITEIASERPSLGCFAPSYAGFHIRNDFCTKELTYAEASGQIILRKNAIQASVSHYGYADYGEMALSVGYGRNFGDRFAMTARIFYLMAHARHYPSRHSLCTDFAIACRASPKLLFDATVYNPFMLRYGIVGQEVIPMRFSIGCTYTPVRKLLLSLSTAKTLPGAWEVDFHFATRPAEPLLLAAECSNHRIGLYVGWRFKRLLFSARAVWHYRISISPEIGGFYFHKML